MNNLLSSFTDELRKLLNSWLPQLSTDWWKRNVVDILTYQQQERIKQSRIVDLSGLDLAALLRVLDQNWFELSQRFNWPKEARNWLKEAQTIRNRWAHAPSGDADPHDAYRDADTMERLAKMLIVGEAAQTQITLYKQQQLARLSPQPASTPSSPPVITPILETPSAPVAPEAAILPPAAIIQHDFSPGQLVRLKSNRNKIFPILSVLPNSGVELRYQVFEDNKLTNYYESQLESIPEIQDERTPIQLAEFDARLTSLLLSSPSSGNLYSLHSGRVRFVPYQYRPVLKLLRSDRPRLLIADDVGVGKTIEAGLILKELQARSEIKSVLIICPKPLVAESKWRNEMKRFGEEFTHLDGDTLRHCLHETDLDGEWPRSHSRAILPFSLIDDALLNGKPQKRGKKTKGLLDLDPPPRFDLVIVDEAHHIRNANTWLHQGVKFFCDNAEAVVFMTATPIQMGNQDLFTLLNVLRPDLVIDRASFDFMAEPNPHIHAAANHLRSAAVDGQQNALAELKMAAGCFSFIETPDFQRVLDTLTEPEISPATRVALIREVERFSTFDSLINRTRRRDIGNFTTRKPETVSVPFTDAQQVFHDQLLATAVRIYKQNNGQQAVLFMLSTLRRQASSCLYALAPFIDQWLDGKLDALGLAEINDDETDEMEVLPPGSLQLEIEQLRLTARMLDPADPKLEAFLAIVRDKQTLHNNKLLVFTSFRHTLSYLERKLLAAGIRVGVIHGGVADEDRRDIRRRFAQAKEQPDTLDVLLSTEVGSEGLDFQFCDGMVNYDLPWNPMRIEQRIGRIDRYGQKSEVVVINNLITPGTVDADIYERCLLRIGVFQQALGASEEILGQISKELHAISESFDLTPHQRQERLQQLADNELREIQEQETLEIRATELFGLSLPNDDELTTTTSGWLKPEALQAAVSRYLRDRSGKEQEVILGSQALKTLRLDADARTRLLEDYQKFKTDNQEARTWERWLKGNTPHLEITFDQDCASDNTKAVLLHPAHPLLRQAAAHLQPRQPVYVQCRVKAVELAAGAYPFALYQWHKQGVRADCELVAVAESPEIEAKLFSLLRNAVATEQTALPAQTAFDALEATHHQRWRDTLANHKEANQQLVDYRLNSLTASTEARLRQAQDQLSKATDEKIRTMKQAEHDRIKADYSRRKEKLEAAKEAADIRAEVVAFGVVIIEEKR
ncbi:MAG: helicase-related protein [Gallionella sp.]|nr:helicase-related protein [Gallionella sp.]